MRVSGQNAFVLHTRPYSESSLLVDVFTHQYGRLTLLAKGARRLKSKQRPYIRSFLDLSIGWSGKGELPVLTGAELAGNFVTLRGTRLYCGLYLNELMSKLLQRGDPHEQLFQDYANSVALLWADEPLDAVVRAFEKTLLKEIGYAMILHQEAGSTTPVHAAQSYRYIAGLGPVKVTDKTDYALRRSMLVSGSTLLALHKSQPLHGREKRESKLLSRMLLDDCLDGKKINSRRLLNGVRLRSTTKLNGSVQQTAAAS